MSTCNLWITVSFRCVNPCCVLPSIGKNTSPWTGGERGVPGSDNRWRPVSEDCLVIIWDTVRVLICGDPPRNTGFSWPRASLNTDAQTGPCCSKHEENYTFGLKEQYLYPQYYSWSSCVLLAYYTNRWQRVGKLTCPSSPAPVHLAKRKRETGHCEWIETQRNTSVWMCFLLCEIQLIHLTDRK